MSGIPVDLIGGNVYPKYTTANPIAHALMKGFLGQLDDLVDATGARDIHEIGCGEGYLSARYAARGAHVRGSDISAAALGRARERAVASHLDIRFRQQSLYDLDPDHDAANLVICCEVLEHLPDPERALNVLIRLARPHLILSVPREPIWRVLNLARGAYWSDLGNTPGHLQHWSRKGFLEFVGRHIEIVGVRSPLPWTLVSCHA